jgi:hypothetical protein
VYHGQILARDFIGIIPFHFSREWLTRRNSHESEP